MFFGTVTEGLAQRSRQRRRSWPFTEPRSTARSSSVLGAKNRPSHLRLPVRRRCLHQPPYNRYIPPPCCRHFSPFLWKVTARFHQHTGGTKTGILYFIRFNL